ncbi:hypothetical protein PRIPAC_84482 [Pristionchus pacificus]|uniref:Uncharacterized protein n=1 Tax=Pristionchus pacificus TaxID=54126 RepID=A0A2A6BKU9_PRIPA|nr:hypothetical protein PRIPAC_84482 [Pristionchus pacificus]|eukprot:PDM66544.1 hypothetical protein PRIPAC_47961 [Pristionchus pacificus]
MVHSADPSPVKVPRGPIEHSTPPSVPLETKFVNFAPRKTTRKMSQFDSSYKKLLSSISSLSPLVTSIENDISQIFETSSSDEIEKISARVARILVDAQIIRDDYSDLFSSLIQSVDSMDDNDSSKDVEQRKLQEFKSSSEAATSMEVDPVSVANVVSKLENKFRRSLETATVRASALSRLTPPISIPSQSIPLPSTPVDGDSTSTSTAHIEYQTLAAKIVDLEARLSNSNAQSSPHSNIVLPPITLQTFDGVDITKWPAYKYQLDMLILNQPQYNEVEKICYVRSTLRGTALSLISTIPTNKDFLAKIIARLETEYSRPNLTQATLLQSLLKVQSKSNKLEDQLDTVRIMINLVHSISDDCGLDGLVMQQQIADRIHPRFIPVIWRRRSTTLLESLELIEETLRTELEDVTMINAISDRNHHQKSVVVNNYSGGLSMPRSSVTNSSPPSHKAPRGPKCVFCGNHNYSFECTTVKLAKDRKEILRRKKLCFCCFSSEHNSADCSKKCAKCSGKHHRSICDKPSNTAINMVSMQQPERLFTTTATVANPVSNTFATAHVLLDHGAQATLISRDLVNRLALIPFETREMAISGINGDPSKVSPHDIVNVDIVTDRGKVHIEAIVREGASVNTIYTDPLPRDDLEVIQATIGSVPSHFSESSTVHSDLLLSIGDTLELLESATETKLPCGYRLVQSSIGPLVVGSNRPRTRKFDPIVSALTIHKDETLDEKIERLFAVDPIARVYETTEKEARKVANALVNQHFDDTVEKQGDEYIVQYSVKPEAKIDLPSNFDLAVSRLTDVEKAFLQVKLHHSQRNMLRFLWVKNLDKPASNSNILVLRFCVTPFGINASPSILNKVIHHHVRLNGTNCDPTLIHQLVSNLYVDNVIINVDLPTSLMYTESKSLFGTMSMNLRDYASNDPSFLSIVPESDRAKDETQKILGLLWNTTTDRLSINIPISNKSGKVSKRSMLTFSDASKQAMAACIYSWSSNAQPTLLISKTRLAPIKCTSTIPKMELDSLVTAHTLVRFTVEALRKEFPEKPIHAYFYSDSAVVLHWCKPEFRKQPGVFVVNRIKKIHDTRDELASFNPVIYHHPRHVRSESNPADHATRGLSAKDMNDPKHAWWSGPEWLKYDPDSWPNDDLSSIQCPSIDSFPMAISAVAVVPPIETVIKLERFSSLRKAIAVTSRVYRFLSICASRVQNTSIHEKLKHLPTITSPVPSAVERRPPEEENSSREAAIQQLKRSITIVDAFWNRWHIDEPEPINTHPMTTRSKKTPEERDPNRSLAPEPIDIPSNVKNKVVIHPLINPIIYSIISYHSHSRRSQSNHPIQMPVPTTVVAKPKKPKILFDHDRVVKDITNSVEKKMKKIVLNVVTEGVGLLKEHFDSLVSQLSMSVDSLSDVVSTNLVDPTPIVVHATDVTPSTTRPPHVTTPVVVQSNQMTPSNPRYLPNRAHLNRPRSTSTQHRQSNRNPIPAQSHKSHSRSRSPISRNQSHHPQCVFCKSTRHFTRNCDVVTSLHARLSITHSSNRCTKCFRILNASHRVDCEPNLCTNGCVTPQGGPERHCYWFCPANPALMP